MRRRRPRALQGRDGPLQATCRPRLKEEEGSEHAQESRVSSHLGLLGVSGWVVGGLHNVLLEVVYVYNQCPFHP